MNIPARVKLPGGFGEGTLIAVRRGEGLVRYQSVVGTTEEAWLPAAQILVQRMAWAPLDSSIAASETPPEALDSDEKKGSSGAQAPGAADGERE